MRARQRRPQLLSAGTKEKGQAMSLLVMKAAREGRATEVRAVVAMKRKPMKKEAVMTHGTPSA